MKHLNRPEICVRPASVRPDRPMLTENLPAADTGTMKTAGKTVRKKPAKTKHKIRIRGERRTGFAEKRLILRKRKTRRMVRFRSTMRYEIGNLVTHSVGLGLAICGTVFLIAKSISLNNQTRLISFAIYGACIIFLYLASSTYHALWAERSKKFYRRVDHSAIYLAISGTFTPIALVVVGGIFG